jgi:regulator of cell morphogenesis and NO signaling
MGIEAQTRVADLATHHPATIRVFQRHGIDFCCGGARPLAEVCQELGLSFGDLERELDGALSAPEQQAPEWERTSLTDLVGQIVERYHRPLDEELPRLESMMRKVLGARHPELAQVAATLAAITADLGPHMMKEERILFPFVVRLEAASASGAALAGSPFGSVQGPIGVMEAEHEAVAEALRELRKDTSGFEAPDDACNTFRGLYHGLAELEQDLHEHIHVENNVLFPRAQRLEQELRGVGSSGR